MAPTEALSSTPLFGPHGSLSSSIIPAGRLGTRQIGAAVCPLSLSPNNPGLVLLAVKGPLCRFAPWTAPGRSRRSLFTRKKEGSDTGKWHQTPGPPRILLVE